jgi:DNA-binding SARP family transcriptional activator
MQQERETCLEQTRERLVELLALGRQAALAEWYEEARRTFEQVWAAAGGASELASEAAWGIAWLELRSNNYQGAADWFARVDTWPNQAARLWPFVQQQMIGHCSGLARRSPGERTAAMRPASLPALKITNLGRFQIMRGGRMLPVCTARKAIGLLRYLLTRRHYSAHRDELIELFWPEAGPHDATHSLHVAIAALRRYLDPPGASYIRFDLGHYAIDPEAPIDDDAHTFQQLSNEAECLWRADDFSAAQQCYLRAIACYQGDYFVDERDTSWVIAEREQLLIRYLTALDRLGRTFVMQQRYESAAECYQMLLERDTYREDVHYQLMSCYVRTGRRREALRQYETCRACLQRELGLEPTDELQAFYRQILYGSPG